jgi:hypothetical protein
MADWLAEHQTLVVGVVGFTGVIITLAVNAHLARMQLVRSALHQANVMRRAMLADLKGHADDLRARMEFMESKSPDRPGKMMIREAAEIEIFTAASGTLGLLTLDEVSAVMAAYAWLRNLPREAAMMAAGPAANGYYAVEYAHVSEILRGTRTTSKKVETAIRELNAELGPG